MRVSITKLKHGTYIDGNTQRRRYMGKFDAPMGTCIWLWRSNYDVSHDVPILTCWDGEYLWEIVVTESKSSVVSFNSSRYRIKIKSSIENRLKSLSNEDRTPEKIRNLIFLELL